MSSSPDGFDERPAGYLLLVWSVVLVPLAVLAVPLGLAHLEFRLLTKLHGPDDRQGLRDPLPPVRAAVTPPVPLSSAAAQPVRRPLAHLARDLTPDRPVAPRRSHRARRQPQPTAESTGAVKIRA